MRCCLILLILTLPAAAASACPVCESGTGEQVRAGITDDLGISALAVLLPFAVLLAIVAAIHFGFPRARSNDDDAA